MRYDAVEFLKGLYDPAPDIAPDDLPGDWRVQWEERATSMEHSGGLHRELAEHKALLDIVKQMNAAD